MIFYVELREGHELTSYSTTSDHSKYLILNVGDSRHSQLHFGTKIFYILACVANLRLIFSCENRKLECVNARLMYFCNAGRIFLVINNLEVLPTFMSVVMIITSDYQ